MSLFSLIALGLLIVAASFVFFGLRLQEEGTDSSVGVDDVVASRQTWGLVIIIGLVVSSSTVYAILGNPRAIVAQEVQVSAPNKANVTDELTAAKLGAEQVELMVASLAAKLEKNPNDARGWRMLARSYETLKRFPLAIEAYKKLVQLEANNPEIWTDYAVTLAIVKDQTLVGEPEALIKKALELDPSNVQALALVGSAAFERHDYEQAIERWTQVLKFAEPESDIARSIISGIEKAKQLRDQQQVH